MTVFVLSSTKRVAAIESGGAPATLLLAAASAVSAAGTGAFVLRGCGCAGGGACGKAVDFRVRSVAGGERA